MGPSAPKSREMENLASHVLAILDARAAYDCLQNKCAVERHLQNKCSRTSSRRGLPRQRGESNLYLVLPRAAQARKKGIMDACSCDGTRLEETFAVLTCAPRDASQTLLLVVCLLSAFTYASAGLLVQIGSALHPLVVVVW